MMRHRLKLVLCNERLIFRFGVDRILLMLGRELLAQGHDVTFACIRCDEQVTALFGARVHMIKQAEGLDLHSAESAATAALDDIIETDGSGRAVDVIVTGGWPFFGAAQLGLRRAIKTLFIDAGAVPHDGFTGPALQIQREVRRLRAASVPHFSSVLPISTFVRDSQTIPDRGHDDGVEVVRLGVDHLDDAIFKPTAADGARERAVLAELRGLSARGVPLLLNLGRYEPVGYKNSPAVFDTLRVVLKTQDKALLLLLGRIDGLEVPADCRNNVRFIGFPSDPALAEVMRIADAGISTSRWEGFNLPIGEMQNAGRPVVALNAGAHPEVIMNPWCLASSIAELGTKVAAIVAGAAPPGIFDTQAFDRYKRRFRWRDVTRTYIDKLIDLAQRDATRVADAAAQARRLLFIDVSNSSRDTANSGVTRVTRKLSAQLQQLSGLELVFLYWDVEARTYRLVGPERRACLEAYGGPKALTAYIDLSGHVDEPARLGRLLSSAGDRRPILFLPEIAMDGQAADRVGWGRAAGFDVAAILYDLIPIHHPEFCDPAIVALFPEYLEAVARTDLVMSISQASLDLFQRYAEHHRLDVRTRQTTKWLPGQFADEDRRSVAGKIGAGQIGGGRSADGPVRMLCISTLEPRKNHINFLRAAAALIERRPELDVRITLIGNRYNGAPELADYVEEMCRKDARFSWLKVLPDEQVAAEIEQASFLVYPSLVEGFGLPILESLWMGKPCVCHNQGVMSELAAPGGCLTVNMLDPVAISQALERLSVDEPLRLRLESEARTRAILGWQDYAEAIAAELVRC